MKINEIMKKIQIQKMNQKKRKKEEQKTIIQEEHLYANYLE